MSRPRNLCLASNSPRRNQILSSSGFSFYTVEPTAEEMHPDAKRAEKCVVENAVQKAESVIDRLHATNDIVIAADTLVVVGKEVLGKPKNSEEAIRLLQKQSGKKQTVVTGLALVSKEFGTRKKAVKSSVWFHKLSRQKILGYTSTSEPYDKAGAYAIQGVGAIFIKKIEGSYTNIMGFPLEVFLQELERLTGISIFEFIEPR